MNAVYISGRLGHTPVCSVARNGKKVLKMTLAVTEYRAGEKVTEWLDFEAWDKTAELIERDFNKGDTIGLFGKLKKDTWEKDGERKSKTYILVSQIEYYRNASRADIATTDEGFSPAVTDGEGDLPF